eukprot:scaffold164207_cov28-Tisochrysis_lutea.AAC.1
MPEQSGLGARAAARREPTSTATRGAPRSAARGRANASAVCQTSTQRSRWNIPLRSWWREGGPSGHNEEKGAQRERMKKNRVEKRQGE